MSKRAPITIYIVDDNKVFTLALKADIELVFDTLPFNIQLFETGEKCMEHFKREPAELIILDYHLNTKYPNAADGLQVLDWIKKEKNETNVIMLTGDDNIDIAVKSFQHGASDYVVKTETKFSKINYSLLNIFKVMEAKRYERNYKSALIVFIASVSLLVSGAIAVQFYNTYVLN